MQMADADAGSATIHLLLDGGMGISDAPQQSSETNCLQLEAQLGTTCAFWRKQ